MIPEHLSSDPDFVSQFEEQAFAVAQLRHSNIVQVYDFNHEDNTYYMVLEFIPGETLQDQLKRLNAAECSMPVEDVIRSKGTICEAADFAHERDRSIGISLWGWQQPWPNPKKTAFHPLEKWLQL